VATLDVGTDVGNELADAGREGVPPQAASATPDAIAVAASCLRILVVVIARPRDPAAGRTAQPS
jgi:hypothetical protein